MTATQLARKLRELPGIEPQDEAFDASCFIGYPEIMNQAMEYFHARVDANLRLIGKERADAWEVNIETGTLTFSMRGAAVARASCQLIGTYAPAGRRFLWGWANEAPGARLCSHALSMRAYGEFHGVAALLNASVEASETAAWHFAALANYLTKSCGVFRAKQGDGVRFLTLQDIAAV